MNVQKEEMKTMVSSFKELYKQMAILVRIKETE
jgi:hypothetical protein